MPELVDITTRLKTLWFEGVEIWLSGGWAMIAIAVIALVMFMVGLHVWFRLRDKGHHRVKEGTWRRWLDEPEQRRGPVGELIDFVLGATSLDHLGIRFEQVHTRDVVGIERDLRVMKICVSAAPLVGLLGTVTGMLSTFGALASGSGGEKTLGLVAGGISEALVTTETGLVIALPGLFFHFQLVRNYERYKAFLAHLETVCAQRFHAEFDEAPVHTEEPDEPTTDIDAPPVEVLSTAGEPVLSGSRDI